jgi:ACS family hexuronate transporter-like MFS transporter
MEDAHCTRRTSPSARAGCASMSDESPRGRRPILRLRWYIVGLLFAGSAISYIDRQALSINAPAIRDEFGLTNTEYAYLVTAFLVAYTFGYSASGYLVDKIGTRLAFTFFMVSWSIVAALHGFASGFGSLGALRFLLGLAEAGAVPASMRAISEWFPERERSMASGIFAAGTPGGILLAAPLVAFLTLSFGWRMAFIVTGLFGLLWLVPWLWLYHVPERHPRISPVEQRWIVGGRVQHRPGTARMADLLRYRQPWAIIIGRFMMDPVWWFYVFWLPNYLADERGFSLQAIGEFAWIPFVAGMLGTVSGGCLSAWLVRRYGSLTFARKAVLFLSAAGSLLGIPAVFVSDAWLSLTLICLVTFSLGAWATTIMTLAADILPPNLVGSMTGLSGTGAALGGIVFTVATGWLVDNYSYWPVFALAATSPLVGFAVLTRLMPEIRQIHVERPLARRGQAR